MNSEKEARRKQERAYQYRDSIKPGDQIEVFRMPLRSAMRMLRRITEEAA